MYKVVKEYIKVFPWFFNRYLVVVSDPTKFAMSKALTSPSSTKESLKFFAGAFLVTMVIGFAVIENSLELARDLLFQLVILMPLAGLLTLAWKIVRVEASFKPTMLLLLYFFGAFLPIVPVSIFLMKGMQTTYGVHGYWAWGFITFFVMVAWSIACWNAYRKYFQASITKAIGAGMLALVFLILTFNFAQLLLAGAQA
ncbi:MULTISPECIES: hypothetical protein [Chromobacterium]|uniref:hypothetical protein n=1 Tax=Chromobacterium TaxID=535 RepID=UPI0018882F49|nr:MULTISPECIES: hypothetical protein [Chromobacterium]QOZ84262.1 hypothetical protein DXT74_14970 [Chromobacterium sp. Rain0013]WON84435.1 hypothetical protein OK026_02630 [Chromobacterium haemolyticum]